MSRNIRRIRRNVESYVPPNKFSLINCNLESEGYAIRRNIRGPRCMYPSLGQRVNCIEGEIADINVALADHVSELNNHECRIEKIENHIKKERCLRPAAAPIMKRCFNPKDTCYKSKNNCNKCKTNTYCNKHMKLNNHIFKKKCKSISSSPCDTTSSSCESYTSSDKCQKKTTILQMKN